MVNVETWSCVLTQGGDARALVLQLSATLSSNGWMAEWSKAADSRNPFLPHQT